MWSAVTISLATGIMVFTPGPSAVIPGWLFLVFFRVFVGIGNAGIFTIDLPLVQEFIPAYKRGWVSALVTTLLPGGGMLAGLVASWLLPIIGWRYLFLVGLSPLVLVFMIRYWVPESPRWLIQRGRSEEAAAEVEKIEAGLIEREREGLSALHTVEVSPVAAERQGGTFAKNLAALFRGPMARTTLMLWGLWLAITFSYYGFFTWIPTLLVKQGMTITKSFGYSIVIYLAQIPGYYSAAFLSEKLDRKWTIVVYMLLGGASACLLSLFMNGTYAAIYAYTPELYPTAFRATGMGVASAVGRIGGLCAPIVIGFTFAFIGFGGVFLITTAVLVLGALSVALLGIATAGKSLEQITRELGS
jgi:putative MFS transporter